MNYLPADDSHEISSLICLLKNEQIFENIVCCNTRWLFIGKNDKRIYWFHFISSLIPKSFKEDFVSEGSHVKNKMDSLKHRIRTSGLEVFDK